MEQNQTSPNQAEKQRTPTQPTTNGLKTQRNSGFFTNRKKFIFLFLGLIFFLLATSALTLRKSQTKPPRPLTPPLSVTPTPAKYQTCNPGFIEICEGGDCECFPQLEETANWKTYRNEEYGFEIKYPDNIYELYTSDSRISFYISTQSPQTTFEITAELNNSRAHEAAKLDIAASKLEKSLCCVKGKLKTSFQNLPAYTIVNLIEGPETMTNYSEHIIFLRGANQYTITYSSGAKNIPQKHKNTINQILSTFKFIETCNFDDTTCPEGYRCVLVDALPGSKGICTDEIPEPEKSCLAEDGIWLQDYTECENVSKQQCDNLGGSFKECASSCRHVPNLPNIGICSKQCIQVCKF